MPWIPAAARTRCQEAQGRGGAGSVAKSMNGHYEVAYKGIPLGKRGCGRLLGRGGPSRGGSCVGCASQYQGAVKETPRGLSRLDSRVPKLCPVWRRWGGSCPLATPRREVQGQDGALHRFGGLTLVGLWGPRPWVPPYPGPRNIKASAGAGRGRAFPRGLRPFGRGFCNPAQPKLG